MSETPAPTKPFKTADGRTFHRRGNILMGEWHQYAKELPITLGEEAFWVGVFLGTIPTDAIKLPAEERIALTDAAFANWSTDDYFAVAEALFISIRNPAANQGTEGAQS